MRPINEWYYFTSAIDKKTCNKIKAIGNNDFKAGHVDTKKDVTEEDRINGVEKEYALSKKSRDSEVSWTCEQWIIELVWPYMMEANEQSGWNFNVTAVEGMQITRYKPGSFYGWHVDGGGDCLSAYNNPDSKFLHGKVRKLSMTILLNGNYQGGDFQFVQYNKLKNKVATPDFKNAGSVIVFPSFMEHQVVPVTKGTRYSLVAWFVGPPFK